MNRNPLNEAMLCSVCRNPQFSTPAGDTCVNGHGGVEGIPLASENSQLNWMVETIPMGHIQHAMQSSWLVAPPPEDPYNAVRLALKTLGWDVTRQEAKLLSFWFIAQTAMGRLMQAQQEPEEEKDGSDATTA